MLTQELRGAGGGVSMRYCLILLCGFVTGADLLWMCYIMFVSGELKQPLYPVLNLVLTQPLSSAVVKRLGHLPTLLAALAAAEAAPYLHPASSPWLLALLGRLVLLLHKGRFLQSPLSWTSTWTRPSPPLGSSHLS